MRVSDVSAANVFKTTAYSNFSFAVDNNSYTLTAGAENKDFVYDADTKFIVATYDNRTGVKSAVLTEGSYANLDANDVVLAVYSTTPITVPGVTVANLYTAKYVYILKASTEDINVPATTGSIHYTVNVLNRITGAVEPTMTRDFTSTGLVAKTYTTTDYPASWILTQVGYDAAQYSVSTCTPSVVVTAGNTAEVVLTVYHN